MDISGIGTDIIECERIERMIHRHGDHFVRRVYTESEIRYCSNRKSFAQHYAGRWAAKEAVLKAIGTGWIAGIAWTDVEVANESSGKPVIHLHGGAERFAAERNIGEIRISISHCQSHAVAFAVAVSSSSPDSGSFPGRSENHDNERRQDAGQENGGGITR